MCNNMDKSQKNSGKWKRWNEKYDLSICMIPFMWHSGKDKTVMSEITAGPGSEGEETHSREV
jgi:hypothetical protein